MTPEIDRCVENRRATSTLQPKQTSAHDFPADKRAREQKRLGLCAICAAAVGLVVPNAYGQTTTGTGDIESNRSRYESSRALIVAIGDYSGSDYPDLGRYREEESTGVHKDADRIKAALAGSAWDTRIVRDPTLSDLKAAIDSFYASATVNERLLLYVAAHGRGQKVGKQQNRRVRRIPKAWIIPKPDSVEPSAIDPSAIDPLVSSSLDLTALPVSYLIRHASQSKARDGMVVIDACQIGLAVFTQTAAHVRREIAISHGASSSLGEGPVAASSKSRVYVTSGYALQSVSASSGFNIAFAEALQLGRAGADGVHKSNVSVDVQKRLYPDAQDGRITPDELAKFIEVYVAEEGLRTSLIHSFDLSETDTDKGSIFCYLSEKKKRNIAGGSPCIRRIG